MNKDIPNEKENEKTIANLIKKGVIIPNAHNVIISDEAIIEENVLILPNSIILGPSVIEKNAQIGPNSIIINSHIFMYASILCSYIVDSKVGMNTTVGPFAHLREQAIVGDDCRIGNFVEIKKSEISANTKASHLAYIGDAQIGENVNFGCGSITVNFDGYNKYKTVVKDNVFVGCNCNLIAPIEIGEGAFIAAGTTITENIPPDAFSISRVKQITKENYALKYRNRGKKNDQK